jgi:ubiquinone/menaquinone biosynthesis C-methylase UbiE
MNGIYDFKIQKLPFGTTMEYSMLEENRLHEKIKNRYEGESNQACVLSCGSTLQELNIKRGDVVLDLGCGRGEETIEAAKLAGPEGMAIGLDLTEAMVIQVTAHES